MYQKSTKGWMKHYDFILLDLLSLQAAFIIAYMIRHGVRSPYVVPTYRNMAVYLIITDMVVLLLFETMKSVIKRGYYRELAATLRQVIMVELLSCLYLFTFRESNGYSRSVLYMTGFIYFALSYFTRIVWKRHLRKTMNKGNERSLLIVTDSQSAETVVLNLKEKNYERFKFTGIILIDCNRTGEEIVGVPVVADMATAAAYALSEWIDEVMIIPSADNQLPTQLIDQFMEAGITVHVNLIKLSGMVGKQHLVERIGGYTVLTTSLKYATAQEVLVKRLMDICGGLIGCVLTGIVFLFVAPAIYAQSPGPIFFSQVRIGKNGKKFKMYKFRSMYMDAEERQKDLMDQNRNEDGMMFKMDFDPRVIGNKILPDGTKKTGIGQFIRDTSLDEFPQFLNVLLGSMSLVGTRPPTQSEYNRYLLHHRARLSIKPGMTGLWQISGRSQITNFEEVVRLDKEYIEKWSIGRDIKILFKTIEVVVKRSGSM